MNSKIYLRLPPGDLICRGDNVTITCTGNGSAVLWRPSDSAPATVLTVPAAVVIANPQYIHTLPPTAAVVIAEPEHAVPPMGVGKRRVTVGMSWNVSNPMS